MTFRTNALPWLVSDGRAFHVFWAEREPSTNVPRIKYSSTTTGTSWRSPDFVDNYPGLPGFQVIPSAGASEGVVQVAWYDTRDDLTPSQGPLINGLPFVNDYRDAQGNIHRHTIDVRAAQGVWDGSKLVFSKPSPFALTQSIKVSSYLIGLAPPGFLGRQYAAGRRSAREQLCELPHLPAGENAVCRRLHCRRRQAVEDRSGDPGMGAEYDCRRRQADVLRCVGR